MAKLRYYIAHNSGLRVSVGKPNAAPIGEFFAGKTVDHVTGSTKRPERVFAAVDGGGGYRTTDGGKTWQKVIDAEVRQWAFDPHDDNIVYAGMCPVRLLRSEDGGTTWEPLDSLLEMPAEVRQKWDTPLSLRGIDFPHVRDIHVHPDDSLQIFVLLEHGGVVLTQDGGKTWDDRSAGIAYLDMHHIDNVAGSKDAYLVSSARGFFRTGDRGKNWHRTEEGMPWGGHENLSYSHEWMYAPAGSNRIILAGAKGSPGFWFGMFPGGKPQGPDGHLLLSEDLGKNWRLITNGVGKANPWFPWVILRDPTEARTLYCGMGDGSKGFAMRPEQRGSGAWYVSRDEGESWECILADQPAIMSAWVAAD